MDNFVVKFELFSPVFPSYIHQEKPLAKRKRLERFLCKCKATVTCMTVQREPWLRWRLNRLVLKEHINQDKRYNLFGVLIKRSLRERPTFCDAAIDFLAKLRLRNDCKNSVLMTSDYPDLGLVSGKSCQLSGAPNKALLNVFQYLNGRYTHIFNP